MLKKKFTCIFSIVFIFSFVYVGSIQASQALSSGKIIKLSFAHHEPPVSPSAKIYAEWAKKVEEQANGKVKISVYPAQSLVNSRDLWASVTGGVADIGLAILAESSKELPLSTVMRQSVTGIPDGMPGLQVWNELWTTFPELRAEFKQVKILFYFVTSASCLHTANKEVRLPEDIKGMKFVCPPGGTEAEFLRLAGASPVALPATEWFMAQERGMAEGGMYPYQAMQIFGTTELLKFHVNPSSGPNMLFAVMNIDKWNSLPPDIQKIFKELGPPTNELLTKQKVKEVNLITGKAKDMGHVFLELTPEDRGKWDAAVKPASEKWIQETEALGKPAKKVFEKAIDLAKKYSK